jgi:hypothetical protein
MYYTNVFIANNNVSESSGNDPGNQFDLLVKDFVRRQRDRLGFITRYVNQYTASRVKRTVGVLAPDTRETKSNGLNE